MKNYGIKFLTAKIKKTRTVYLWWSASETIKVQLVGWKRTRMSNGGTDTNKLGVGAVVYSEFTFRDLNKKQRSGLPKDHVLLPPYIPLYTKNPWPNSKAPKVKRPTLKEISA